MTNFERIKFMSIDDMASMVEKITDQTCKNIDNCECCPWSTITCGTINDIIHFLESEAEDND